jgi:hypothetical protein
MTDYNDGNWHGWNGGECPVHPDSEVEAVYHTISAPVAGLRCDRRQARQFVWDAPVTSIIAFRVTKPYREPREIWVNEGHDGWWGYAYETRTMAEESRDAAPFTRIAVRYVEALE